jgi:hypothetical protein
LDWSFEGAKRERKQRARVRRRADVSSTVPPLPTALELQRDVGNQAVQAWLRSEGTAVGPQLSHPAGVTEPEAEQITNYIMRTHGGNPAAARPDVTPLAPAGDSPGVVGEVLRSSGKPLDEQSRRDFEQGLGSDFGQVRVHDGPLANEAAAAVNAEAFTAGSHVVFSEGRYSPDTQAGQRLLAHELVHVIQQGSKPAPSLPVGGAGHTSAHTPAGTGPAREIQRQPALRLALPRQELRARGNPDINALVDALPAVLLNGQRVQVLRVTESGTTHVFTLTITITPGAPPITSPVTAETSETPGGPVGSPNAQTWQHDIAINLYQQIPDPVSTLFHELVHVRLLIDKYLSPANQTTTFQRYSRSSASRKIHCCQKDCPSSRRLATSANGTRPSFPSSACHLPSRLAQVTTGFMNSW